MTDNQAGSAPDAVLVSKIEAKVLELLSVMFDIDQGRLGRLDPDKALFEQLSIDSLQAFDSVVTLHDIMEEDIPPNIDPTTISTLKTLSAYIAAHYPVEKVNLFLEKDIAKLLSEMSENADQI